MSAPSAPEPAAAPGRPALSLAARLTAWYAGTAFAMVALASGCLYWALESRMGADQDARLADQVQILRANLGRAADVPAMLQSKVVDEMAARRFAQVYVRVLDAGGGLVIETPGMARVMPAAEFPAPRGGPAAAVQGHQAFGGDAGPFRVAAAAALIPGRGLGTIQIALANPFEQGLLASYRAWLAALLVIAFALSISGGYVLARSGLRPLRRFSATIGGISSARLDARIAAAGLPAELAALGASFNGALARLEDAFARLRRFSADIAHELRTPVNNLRGGTEVALGRPRSPEEYRDVLASSLEECERLARLIDTLLFVARAESPHQQIARERIDLDRELTLLGRFYGPMAEEAGISLQVAADAGAAVRGDRTLLQRAVGNLVENALAHTPAGGRVTLRAARAGDRVVVAVEDTGAGIPADHLPYVFDRFHRVEQARSNPGGHVGLGLSIVRGIATLHGGEATIASVQGQGTAVTMSLPHDQTVMNAGVPPA